MFCKKIIDKGLRTAWPPKGSSNSVKQIQSSNAQVIVNSQAPINHLFFISLDLTKEIWLNFCVFRCAINLLIAIVYDIWQTMKYLIWNSCTATINMGMYYLMHHFTPYGVSFEECCLVFTNVYGQEITSIKIHMAGQKQHQNTYTTIYFCRV